MRFQLGYIFVEVRGVKGKRTEVCIMGMSAALPVFIMDTRYPVVSSTRPMIKKQLVLHF